LIILFVQNLYGQKNLAKDVNQKVNHSISKSTNKIKEKSKSVFAGFFNAGITEVKRNLCISGSANSNGWGIGLHYGKIRNKKHTNWFNISLSEVKHDKEQKIKPNSFEVEGYGKPLPYIFGKQNSLYCIDIGYSQQRLLLKGFITPLMNVSLIYGFDLSLGLLKPYYLKIKYTENNALSIENEKYSISNADTFLANNKIYSRSNFGYGLNETQLVPGIRFHASTQIDIGSSVWIKAIRFGTSLSLYTKKIELLAFNKQNSFSANLSLAVVFGKGW
jgi:hypothetical protein